jgi:hypothetical protein
VDLLTLMQQIGSSRAWVRPTNRLGVESLPLLQKGTALFSCGHHSRAARRRLAQRGQRPIGEWVAAIYGCKLAGSFSGAFD